jgi:hypothetical protein
MSLFDAGEPVEAVRLSIGQRRTLRQQALLSQGLHPFMRRPLAQNGETCGTCAHHRTSGYTGRIWHKCDYKATSSEATDIRVGWPACELWKPEPQDAA